MACSPLVPQFFCAVCKTELDSPEPPCPTCGGMVREIFADVDTWTFSDVETGLKARDGGGVGEVRPRLEQSTKIRWNGDRQRYERREIVVDRKNDRYRQSWFDCETGERMFHKEGRNSDPTMHGKSARRGKPKEPPAGDASATASRRLT